MHFLWNKLGPKVRRGVLDPWYRLWSLYSSYRRQDKNVDYYSSNLEEKQWSPEALKVNIFRPQPWGALKLTSFESFICHRLVYYFNLLFLFYLANINTRNVASFVVLNYLNAFFYRNTVSPLLIDQILSERKKKHCFSADWSKISQYSSQLETASHPSLIVSDESYLCLVQRPFFTRILVVL